jgi:hypothetical protein
MKKQLLIAAIAATMSSAAMADISITGDAFVRYANNEVNDTNSLDQRVRLKFVGTAGDVKVVMGLRSDNDEDDTTRVEDANSDSNGLEVDYRYLTAKVADKVTIKAGDWWETTGLGLVRKGQGKGVDKVAISTTVNGVKLAVQQGVVDSADTAADSVDDTENNSAVARNTTINASTTLSGISLGIEHNTTENTGYTDVTVKGKKEGVNFAFESYSSDADAGDADAYVGHVFTKYNDVTYHVAYANWEADSGNARANNKKFSPLGVSILGTANGVNGNLALGNVNSSTNGEDTVFGVRADFNVAGMKVQTTVGSLELNALETDDATTADGKKDTFKDIIVTRALGKGASLKLSAGEWNGLSSMGAKISVKF